MFGHVINFNILLFYVKLKTCSAFYSYEGWMVTPHKLITYFYSFTVHISEKKNQDRDPPSTITTTPLFPCRYVSMYTCCFAIRKVIHAMSRSGNSIHGMRSLRHAFDIHQGRSKSTESLHVVCIFPLVLHLGKYLFLFCTSYRCFTFLLFLV